MEEFYYTANDLNGCEVAACCPIKNSLENCCPTENCFGVSVNRDGVPLSSLQIKASRISGF